MMATNNLVGRKHITSAYMAAAYTYVASRIRMYIATTLGRWSQVYIFAAIQTTTTTGILRSR